MKNRKYTIIAVGIAFVFWFLDASIHYYIYDEPNFEFIPDNFNELWMRTVIILLAILFGVYADSSIKKLLIKEKQLEAARVYNSMTCATQHILNNLLNQMQLFKIEALKSNDFDREIIKLYDNSINEATELIQKLSHVENITDENIWASVDPANSDNSSSLNNLANAKEQVPD
jgi:uncharacterized membrane protein (DUF106 family)